MADTGPLFVKYNGIMRGLGCEVPSLQEQMVKLCCSRGAAAAFEKRAITFEMACERANKYVTTLHAINSAVVKLSKLTKVTKVYRGMSGMTLPEQFMKSNEVGVRGGIETSFMSTSVDRNVALAYASGDVGLVLEIEQGMVSRGADIRFISQYPHEKEVSAQPGTILERSQRPCMRGAVSHNCLILCADLVCATHWPGGALHACERNDARD